MRVIVSTVYKIHLNWTNASFTLEIQTMLFTASKCFQCLTFVYIKLGDYRDGTVVNQHNMWLTGMSRAGALLWQIYCRLIVDRRRWAPHQGCIPKYVVPSIMCHLNTHKHTHAHIDFPERSLRSIRPSSQPNTHRLRLMMRVTPEQTTYIYPPTSSRCRFRRLCRRSSTHSSGGVWLVGSVSLCIRSWN